jgi:hypothetical protein
MSWRDFWKSSRVKWLENELVANKLLHSNQMRDLREAHDLEVARLQSVHESARELLEKAHADHLRYVIEENQKLRDDLDRTRLLLNPALQSVELPKERTEPPKPTEESEIGTPWQRLQRRHAHEMMELDKAERAKKSAPILVPVAPAVEGEHDGSVREGRNEAPLGQPGKTT